MSAFLRTVRPTYRAASRLAPCTAAPIRSLQTSRIAAAVKTLYTPEHEWIRYDDASNEGVIGITNHAQDSLGDVVFIELPSADLEVAKGDQIGSIESVKAASDIYSPVNGIVTDVNVQLGDQPNLVNKSAEADVKLSNPSDLDELLNEEAYKATLE
ncbi:hypothetical protein MVES_003362 [Malassezia vespertilionis]|uniref:Lipoyl-binding domain-containing protein n=1 Tax=Malassezia vespertilionis TaxID=2020962 RepID=A0A2N1J7J5_9BASI|nr:hypothetical protein MVES_003362 [Malassezia vespertilionis]